MDYKSKKWKRLREAALRRDNYLCQTSARYGRTVQATTVHHILPVRDYPEYSYKLWNLISLSAAEHNRLHDRDTDSLTIEGLRLADKILKKIERKEID